MTHNRIAIFVPGGVGEDHYIPSLVQLLDRVSESVAIHLYSFSPVELHPDLARRGISCTIPSPWFHHYKFLSIAFMLLQVLRNHRAQPFTALQAFWVFPAGVAAVLAKIIFRLPLVLTLPGGDTVHLPAIHYGGMKSPIHRALVRWCCNLADHVVMLTRNQETIARANGVNFKRMSIIPYGVDTEQFSFQPRELSLPLRLISIGSLNEVKDVFTQLETFALLCREIDCRFVIVGEDLLHGRARAIAVSLGVADFVEWKGRCTHAELPALLHDAHVMMHTAWYEAEGVVLLEACAAGTVIAGTRVGLLTDLDAGGACTVDMHDPPQIAKKILDLISDSVRFTFIQNKNRHFAEQHPIDRTAAEYASIYEQLLYHPQSH
jgi:glycosyltransferase involved in cell wall biosynthesis